MHLVDAVHRLESSLGKIRNGVTKIREMVNLIQIILADVQRYDLRLKAWTHIMMLHVAPIREVFIACDIVTRELLIAAICRRFF